MIYLVYTIHIFVCLFLILVVLLQQGKGADLSVFGGGSTQTAFGARGTATLLHKMTVGGFVAFIFTTVAIGFLQTGARQGSVMTDVVEETPAAPVTTESPPTPDSAADEALAPEAASPEEANEEAPAAEPPVTEGGEPPEID